jgi:hypothetical protein
MPTYDPDRYAKNPRELAIEQERGGNFVDVADQKAVEKELAEDDPTKGTK